MYGWQLAPPTLGDVELAEQVLLLSPDTKILFISGYTNEVVSSKGILDESVPFLQKPFSPADIISKLKDILSD